MSSILHDETYLEFSRNSENRETGEQGGDDRDWKEGRYTWLKVEMRGNTRMAQ
jgi:hypothetical protein